MDLYSYCNGDPVNGCDPDGRFVSAEAINDHYLSPEEIDAQNEGRKMVTVMVAATVATVATDGLAAPYLADLGIGGRLLFMSRGILGGASGDTVGQLTGIGLGTQKTAYSPTQTLFVASSGGLLMWGGSFAVDAVTPFINGSASANFATRVQQVASSELFQSRALAAGATPEQLAMLPGRLAGYGDAMVMEAGSASADGGFASVNTFRVSPSGYFSSLDQRIAHESAHVLNDIMEPGLLYQDAAKKLSFGEIYQAESFAYQVQYGFNPAPLSALSALNGVSPAAAWATAIGGGVGVGTGLGYYFQEPLANILSGISSGGNNEAPGRILSKH